MQGLDLESALSALLEHRSLPREHASLALGELLDLGALPERVAMFLTALRMKGESVEEIAGFVDCLRQRCKAVQTHCRDVMDVCGTGGDRLGTFNVSTTVSFVLAGSGQPVAKHGNRSVSSRSGSFDVLEALGLRFESDPEKVSLALEEYGLAFLFAPAFHPALKSLAEVRKSLGVSTVFNLLGPLLNPVAQVRRQVIGVYSLAHLGKIAQVQKIREMEEAMIVHGQDGLDELTLGSLTHVTHLRQGVIRSYELRPEDFGLHTAPIESLRGGGPQENAGILVSILKGEKGPRRDVVLLNTSAALVVGGKARDFREGVELAARSIDSGKALSVLRKMGGRV